MKILCTPSSVAPRMALVALVATVACGCSQSTAEGAAIGGAVGAGTGALVGSASGHAGEGAALGATTGALGGAVIGASSDKNDAKKATEKEQKQFMELQAEKMRKQQDELDDLRRQRYHDAYFSDRYGSGSSD